MKRTIFNSILFFGLLLLLSSCEKESVDMETTADSTADLMTILKNDEYRSQFLEEMERVIPQDQRGAEKIIPLIPNYGLILLMTDENGLIEDLALFSVDLGPNDTWTLLPDGSINVHINNDNASGSYFNPSTGDDYCGQNGDLNMSYNGIYTEFTFCLPSPPFPPDTCITIRYIDTSQSTHAFTFHGRADVGPTDPVTFECGPADSKLTAHFVRTNGGQANGFIKLK